MERLNAFLGTGAVSRVTVVPGASAPSRPALPHPLGAIGQTAPEGADKSLAKALERLANLRARLGRHPARRGLD
jgi:hypothetical protein